MTRSERGRTVIALVTGLVILAAIGLAVAAHRTARIAPTPSLPPTSAIGEASIESHVDRFLAPYQAALVASRRPVRVITLEPLDDDALTVSKVGGRAWWPIGREAPNDPSGKPLVLLAQVNFSELPPTPGYPTQGLLQFFIADDDVYGADFDSGPGVDPLMQQRGFRVVYWPDLAIASHALPILPFESLPHDPKKPRRMRFGTGDEVLSMGDYRFDSLFGGSVYTAAGDYAKTNAISEDALMDGVYERYSGGEHKIGGYPYFTQQDPRSGGDRELLLQLNSDDEMMWGDVGVGGFFISPSDLSRADFSHVIYNWDCS